MICSLVIVATSLDEIIRTVVFNNNVQTIIILRDSGIVMRTHDGPQNLIHPYIFPYVYQP